MTTSNSKFLIGLFVMIGLLILSAAIIWVGASRVLMKGSLYSVYFDESVQGLQVDSAIKYRGVEIGTVQKIGVAPDHRLIEVIMKIDLESSMQHQTIASLKRPASPVLFLSNSTGFLKANWKIHLNLILNRIIRSFRHANRKSAVFFLTRASSCKTSRTSTSRAFPSA